jgi:D-glycero-alpha-D-manno-heptose-7-phosphate kinase
VESSALERFQECILLFYTGASRDSSTILGEQTRRSGGSDAIVLAALQSVKAIAYEVKRLLETGKVSEIGELLHASWEQKKQFASGVTKPFVDECYALARKHGATGGKLTGAGGGGFLMLYCEPPHHASVSAALEGRGLKRMGFNFEHSGARVLTNNGVRLARAVATAV